MYDEAMAMLAEPADIKAQLPIAYVLEQAGVHIIHGEGKLHALCPFHADRTPSLDVYAWGEGQRWGCWVCGVGGDIFDLIQKLWPDDYGRFRPAIEAAKRALAKMNAEGWTAPTVRAPLDFDPEAAAALLHGANEWDAIDQLIATKGWRLERDWLVGRWGVRARGREVLVPYVRSDGGLVGLKHRPANGSRPLISLPGSALRGVLYGEQHGAGTPDRPILLTEGESDAWHADRWMSDRYAVLSVPAGAGATPSRLDLLAGRNVVIAFDNDDAGNLGAERWADALGSVGATVGRMELPLDTDLTEFLCS